MMPNWLTNDLKQEVKRVFGKRYKRQLKDYEVETIAANLTDLMESYLKFKWRQKYEKNISA